MLKATLEFESPVHQGRLYVHFLGQQTGLILNYLSIHYTIQENFSQFFFSLSASFPETAFCISALGMIVMCTMDVININDEGWREGERQEGKEGREVAETSKYPGRDCDEEILVSLNFG